ncbi:MAG TPA: winged helix-turn-helix domain-containing protein [Candidatus Acidoferrum sp.]|nr:winged helix-turn-helix domain-containing protein [Candidatus Acidoferrum sp.]
MDVAHLLARPRMRPSGDSTSIGNHDRPADPRPVVSLGESQETFAPERVLPSSGRYICFGPFRVDQQRQEVSRDGARIKLQGKVYQTLLVLLENPGEIVTRDELRMHLWPDDTHVNYDANVNTAVNKLRRALEDSCDEPAYIETISKKGYRFLVQPEVSGMPGNPQLRSEEPSEGAEVPSQTIAVSGFSKSGLWMALAAIGLILAGMLLGARIMSLWINHASRLPRAVAGFDLNHGRSPSGSFTAPSVKPLSLGQWDESPEVYGAGCSHFPISIEFAGLLFKRG